MAKIRHVAIFSKDTRQLADFYKTTFEMIEVASQMPSEPGAEGRRAIYLSDGYINLVGNPRFGEHSGGSNVLPGRQFQFAVTYRF